MERWISIISAMIAVISAALAFSRASSSRNRTYNQVILDILKDYRSPQMQIAVQYLRDFYREVGKEQLTEKYELIRIQEYNKMVYLKEEKKAQFLQKTLHYQRRLVAGFYKYVSSLNAEHKLPQKVFYRLWPEEELRIIPEIIVPIENHLNKVLHDLPRIPLDEGSDLMNLYEGALKYHKSRKVC